MTLEHTALTTMHVRTAPVQSRRRAGVFAWAIAAALLCHTAADAAPIKFEFETRTLSGAPLGEGWFTIDGSTPYPYHLEKNPPAFLEIFVKFYYFDPLVGEMHKDDVATAHFEIGVDPFTGQYLPQISLWAFNVRNPPETGFLQGGLDGNGNGDPNRPPGSNASAFFRTVSSDPWTEEAIYMTFPAQVPEPASWLLLGTAVAGFATRRRLSRR